MIYVINFLIKLICFILTRLPCQEKTCVRLYIHTQEETMLVLNNGEEISGIFEELHNFRKFPVNPQECDLIQRSKKSKKRKF